MPLIRWKAGPIASLVTCTSPLRAIVVILIRLVGLIGLVRWSVLVRMLLLRLLRLLLLLILWSLRFFSVSFTKLLLLPFQFLFRLSLTQTRNLLTIFQRTKELYLPRYGLFSLPYYWFIVTLFLLFGPTIFGVFKRAIEQKILES